MQPTKVIGITGGIGSGKSTIARFFTVLGFPVYNSDERAKELYFDPEIKERVIRLLGEDAYAGGELNKAHIAQKIFSDSTLREKLNAIIHPAVGEDFKKWMQSHSDKKFVIKESALLFETGLYKQCFKNILVTAPGEIRIRRVMQRDKLNRSEVEKKLRSQWADHEKENLADLILQNDGTVLLVPKVLEWLNGLN